MSNKKLAILAILFVIAAVIITACQPEPEVVEVIKTVIVTEEVMVEGTPVIQEVVVTATPEPETDMPVVALEGGAGDVFRVAALSDMTTMNFWSVYGPVNSSFWNSAVTDVFYPSPYGESYHRWDYVPNVAAGMPTELEQDGDFWVSMVPFREDVMWSDGTPVTAHDWAWTAEVALALGLQGNWSSYDPAYLERIEAVDDFTAKVVYHTKPGLSIHQYGVLERPIMPKAFWEPMVEPLLARLREEGADLDPESDEYIALQTEIQQELETLDPTGEPSAGAFMFSEWEEGAYSEIVRDPNYYNYKTVISEYEDGYKSVSGDMVYEFGDTSGEPTLEYTEGPWFDKVLFSYYSSDAAVLALDAGEVDYILTPNGLSRGQAEQLGNNPNIDTAQNPANGFRYLTFNFQQPVLHDKTLRQAVACMIDKQFLTQNLLQGAAIPVNTIVPESNAYWYNSDVPLFCDGMTAQERMEEAVRMLKEAGYTWEVEPTWNEDRGGSVEWGAGLMTPEGTVVPELRLLAPSAGYDPLRATAGVYIEQWMNQLGIPVEAELTNFNRILEVRTDPEAWDMYILGWGLSSFPDYPCYFLQPGSGWNYGDYDSEEFDVRCNELFAETNRESARDIVFDLQEILAEDLPYIYLFTTPMWDAWDSTTVMFPFTDVPDGIGSGADGMQEFVLSVQ